MANLQPFKPGENGKIRARNELAAKVEMLKAAYDASTPASMLMLAIAAQHLIDADRKHHNTNARVRSTNAALRILNDLPKRPAPPAPPLNAYGKVTP